MHAMNLRRDRERVVAGRKEEIERRAGGER